MGAEFFDADGELDVVDEGFREAVTKFVEWHQNGTMVKDVWGGMGGAAYQDAAQEFVNAQLVYYFSGSWQVGRFEETIGDAFDWEVVPRRAVKGDAPECRAGRAWSASRRPSIPRRSPR